MKLTPYKSQLHQTKTQKQQVNRMAAINKQNENQTRAEHKFPLWEQHTSFCPYEELPYKRNLHPLLLNLLQCLIY